MRHAWLILLMAARVLADDPIETQGGAVRSFADGEDARLHTKSVGNSSSATVGAEAEYQQIIDFLGDAHASCRQNGSWDIRDITGTISLPTNAATESTLSAFRTANHSDILAVEGKQDTGNASLAQIDLDLDVALSTRASEPTLSSFKTAEHSDAMVTQGKIDSTNTKLDTVITQTDTLETMLGTMDTDLLAFKTANHSDLLTVEGKQDSQITEAQTANTRIGATTETAPASDTATSGLNGRQQRIAQNITSSNTKLDTVNTNLGTVNTSIGTVNSSVTSTNTKLDTVNTNLGTLNSSVGAVNTSVGTSNTRLGDLTETAPASDTASSGLNGRAQRVAQRLTTLIGTVATETTLAALSAKFSSLGQKAMTSSAPVVIASDQAAIPAFPGVAPYVGLASGQVTASAIADVFKTVYTEQTSNAQRSLVSTAATDSSASTGARTVTIVYYDATLAGPFTETVTLAGLTPVNTVGTNICFIEKMTVATAGSAGVNAGAINLKAATAGGGATVWSISVGDNMTFAAHHYVPTGKTSYVLALAGSSTGGALMSLATKATVATTYAAVKLDNFRSSTQAGNSRDYKRPVPIVGPAHYVMQFTPDTNGLIGYASIDYFDQ